VRPVKLLIDENLSPIVAGRLRSTGFDAVHVRERGLLAATDEEVFAKAHEEDRVVVTSNVDDFLALVRNTEIHGGLALVQDGDLLRDEQETVLRRLLTALEAEYRQDRDMVNRVLFVDYAGRLEFAEIPPIATGDEP
jgi:predicted nuclease of predicted toxin-antitoxin system